LNAAVAKACGVGVQKDSRLLDLVLATVIPDHLTEFHLKMADIPFGKFQQKPDLL
jgi:hypothetical protein